MTQSLEQILAQAEAELRRTGTLNRQALLSAHPAEAAELAPLLETMLLLHEEKSWQRVERRSRSAAQSLFAALTAPSSEVATVSALFAQDRSESGLSVAEQASRSGLPEEALRRLDQVQTPLEALQSNTAIKALAEQVKAPFAALAKEIRRLLSIQSLSSGAPGSAVFTRNAETSSSEEQQALLEKIRQEARRGKKDE